MDFEAILWIAAMIVVPILGLLAELFLFDHGLLWHREEKRGPRNFGLPPEIKKRQPVWVEMS